MIILKNIFKRYKSGIQHGYMRQSACLVVNPITVYSYAVLLVSLIRLFFCDDALEASMRVKQFCVLTTTESRAKIWRQ